MPSQRSGARRLVLGVVSLSLVAPSLITAGADPSAGAPEAVPDAHVFASGAYVEPNLGQSASDALYVLRGDPPTLLTASGMASLVPAEDGESDPVLLRTRFLGANSAPRGEAGPLVPGVSHYLLGNDPSGWIRDVPHHAEAYLRGVYDGVDVVLRPAADGAAEYDFEVAPGVDPSVVRLGFEGASEMRITPDGDLLLATPVGDVKHRAPVTYQVVGGERRVVESAFTLHGAEVGFEIGAFDPRIPLVIDPVVEFATLLGGSGNDEAHAVGIDSADHVYVAGYTYSVGFPTRAPLQGELLGSNDAFVAKFRSSGELVFSTYLGGSNVDLAGGLVVGDDDAPWVVGRTRSANFPTTPGAIQTVQKGGLDVFLVRLATDGQDLLYSTLLGTSLDDVEGGIALGPDGTVHVSGQTGSDRFPLLNPLYSTKGSSGVDPYSAFVSGVSPAGDLVFSTLLGWNLTKDATVAVDSSGFIYLAGRTGSKVHPVKDAWQATIRGKDDVFLTKLTPNAGAIVYSTYVGTPETDYVAAVAADADGYAYVSFTPGDGSFPVKNALSTKYSSWPDGILVAFTPTGALEFSTYLAGSLEDRMNSLKATPGGTLFIGGYTRSKDLPLVQPVQSKLSGWYDGFFVELLPVRGLAPVVVWSTYYGGTLDEIPEAIDVRGDRLAFAGRILCCTGTTGFPGKNALQPDYKGGAEGFVGLIRVGVEACTEAPTLSAVIDQLPAPGGWFLSDVDVRLIGSSVCNVPVRVFHAVDGALETLGGLVRIRGDGIHTLKAYAVDASGLKSSVLTLRVDIDLLPPVPHLEVLAPLGRAGWWLSEGGPAFARASDTVSGVAAIYTSVDGGPLVLDAPSMLFHVDPSRVPAGLAGPGSPSVLDSTIPHVVRQIAVDRAGRVSEAHETLVRFDGRPPSTDALVEGLGAPGGWRSAVDVLLTAIDTGSGADGVYATLDLREPFVPASAIRFAEDGEHTLWFYSVDVAGNREDVKSFSFVLDATAPTTTADLSGLLRNGWYRNAVDVTLAAQDALSGVADTRIAVDGADEASALAATVTADGGHAVTYWSVDAFGNAEAPRELAFKLDSTPPLTTAGLEGPAGDAGWWRGAVTVRLAAEDALSGVAGTRKGVDAGSLAEGDSVHLAEDGIHLVRYRSEDVAGNVEDERAVHVLVDATAPTVRLLAPVRGGLHLQGAPVVALPVDADPIVVGAFEVRVEAGDATSGVRAVEFRVDGVLRAVDDAAPYTFLWDAGAEAAGEHVIEFLGIDVAGNAASASMKVTTLPTTAEGAQATLG